MPIRAIGHDASGDVKQLLPEARQHNRTLVRYVRLLALSFAFIPSDTTALKNYMN